MPSSTLGLVDGKAQVLSFVGFIKWSGADRNRTDDLLLAKQVLYRLSYRPMKTCFYLPKRNSGPFTSPSTAL